MANNYKVRVQIDIVECADTVTDVPNRTDGGAFEYVMSAEQAHDIDACEQILLQTNHAALRDSFASYLSAVSQQHALAMVDSLDACEVKPYRVEGEVGRVIFDAYWVKETETMMDGTNRCLFPTLHAKEWYRTTGFKELALVHGAVEESYRKTSALINRVRHQADATPSRTLRDNAQAEGEQIMAHMAQQATTVLQTHGFTTAGMPMVAAVDHSQQELVTLSGEQVTQALAACAPAADWIAEMQQNPVPYEDPAHSTNVSLDDVRVKRQKATRDGQLSTQKGKYAYNTIAHIARAGASYVINGHNIISVLRLVLAFLLHNDLLRYNLLFFVDGQRTLYTAIQRAFAWFKPMRCILDWYHLQERCKKQLSSASKGRTIRNAVLDRLRPCLWYGCVDRAMVVLQAIDPAQIKDQDALDELMGYLERNRPYIPCYAVRKHLGLRNSSNTGEKANDLIVSDRQKHNGMSWSRCGSVALATITALVRNREYMRWFQTGTLSFGFST